MAETAEKTDPKLWDDVKHHVTEGGKGGKPGQWSARKAQLAVHDYKAAGGGYKGAKSDDNHLHQWTEENWDTKSGKESGKTGERYLPASARAKLSDADYARTTAKKRADTRAGKQFSTQPPDIAHKTAQDRETTDTRATLEKLTLAALRHRAASRNIRGRSRMKKAELVEALA